MKPDFRAMIRTTLRLRCPACGRGALFRRGYTLRDRCPACGLDLRGWHGAHYGGPIILGYALGGLAGILVFTALSWWFGFREWIVWASLAAVVLAVFPTFRHCKAWWTWFLYETGELGRDQGL